MSAPLTRQDVRDQVRSTLAELSWPLDELRVAAALLAMAECDTCNGKEECPDCYRTGLNQAVLARGLAALREGR